MDRFTLTPADAKLKKSTKWDPRLHGIGAQILRSLDVRKMRVMSWPKNIPSMAGFELEVVEYVPPQDKSAEVQNISRKLKAV
jgi:3,4-dihydroxy 2-butanone 4-phosphate synthase/GTP cyclohydrolase II